MTQSVGLKDVTCGADDHQNCENPHQHLGDVTNDDHHDQRENCIREITDDVTSVQKTMLTREMPKYLQPN